MKIWERDYDIVREHHNTAPTPPHRHRYNINMGRIANERWTPDKIGYDAEIDIIKDFLNNWGVTHNPQKHTFTKIK